ncbi:MAG: hypothetical protein JWQ89_2586 [Devosia sp.]|nr:hypothetical protein [Devosia sp.]
MGVGTHRTTTKTRLGFAGRAVVGGARASAFAVVLNPGRPQACEAVFVDGGLPVEELVDGESVTLAGFLKAEQPTANSGDDFGLAANNPTTSVFGRQVSDRQRTTIRTDHVLYTRTHLDGHCTHLLNLTHPEP